jgi:hypothetical protein
MSVNDWLEVPTVQRKQQRRKKQQQFNWGVWEGMPKGSSEVVGA